MFIPWTEIALFHNVKKYVAAYPEILQGNPVVSYKGKVKIHGMNGAVQVTPEGRVAQSRTKILTPEDDNAGFANWVKESPDGWTPGYIIFGEWCGKGIMKGVAISQVPSKNFAVFAARSLEEPDRLIIEPEELRNLVPYDLSIHILPWFTNLTIDFSGSSDEIAEALTGVNDLVKEVEKKDPWVSETFGVDGIGEGVVYYPVSHLGATNFNNLCFKAKGEEHKTIKAPSVQMDASVVSGIQEFVDLVITMARLEQGVTTTGDLDQKNIGKFITWIQGDVQKECQDELEASALTWKQVAKAVSDTARNWYLAKLKE